MREVVYEKANGIEEPTWHRHDSDLAATKWLSSYKTGVFRGSISRDHELAKASRSGVGNDAARRNTNTSSIKGQVVSTANMVYYDTEVFLKGDYDDDIRGEPSQGVEAPWGGQRGGQTSSGANISGEIGQVSGGSIHNGQRDQDAGAKEKTNVTNYCQRWASIISAAYSHSMVVHMAFT